MLLAVHRRRRFAGSRHARVTLVPAKQPGPRHESADRLGGPLSGCFGLHRRRASRHRTAWTV